MFRIVFVILTVLFSFNCAFAEIVILNSGKIIRGKIIERNKDYIKIKFDGNEAYYENKYIKSIEDDSQEAVSLGVQTPETASSYLGKGLKLGSEGKFEEAQEEFGKGAVLDSSNPSINEAIGVLEDLKKGIVTKEYTSYLFQGAFYLINGDYQKAIIPLEKAWEINPNDSNVNYNLGISNYSIKDYKKAAVYFLLVLKLHPDDAEVYVLLGKCYYFLNQYQQAKENLLIAKLLFQKKGDLDSLVEINNILQSIPSGNS